MREEEKKKKIMRAIARGREKKKKKRGGARQEPDKLATARVSVDSWAVAGGGKWFDRIGDCFADASNDFGKWHDMSFGARRME